MKKKRRSAAFSFQHIDGLVVEIPGSFRGAGNTHNSNFAILGQGTNKVEHHTLFPGIIIVQLILHGNAVDFARQFQLGLQVSGL